jgi:stage II sporulation protein D
MKKSHLLFGLMLLGLVLSLEFAVSALAGVSSEVLEKERLARYNINYASYLIDVGKYMDALECYETAAEVTTIPKTKAEALLAKATLLSSFLDAPEEALRVYQEVGKVYKPAAEVAEYRQGLLLFSMRRFDAAKKNLGTLSTRVSKGQVQVPGGGASGGDRPDASSSSSHADAAASPTDAAASHTDS